MTVYRGRGLRPDNQYVWPQERVYIPEWAANDAPSGGELSKHVSVNVKNATRNTSTYILLHRLWVGGEVYEPLRNSQNAMREVA